MTISSDNSMNNITRIQTFVALASALVRVIAAIQALSSKGAGDEAADGAEKFKQTILLEQLCNCCVNRAMGSLKSQ